MNFDIEKRTILKVLHGSHAYGMSTPESDKDYKGVAIPTLEYYFGFLNKFEQAEKYESKGHDYDEVIYDLSKFCKLAGDCNPNVIEVLHVSDKEVEKTTSAGEKLRENADLFISAKAKFTFTGYAHSQLKRINTHRRWLLNPPKEKPTRKAYGLPEDHKLLSKSELGAITAMVKKDETVSLPTNVLESFHRERAYGNALKEWNQYLHWKETRNKKRAELEQMYGFDTKHGAHLVRLLRMGVEILQGEGVIVKRPDADELLAIRRGFWSYDDLMEHAEYLEQRCNQLYDDLKKQEPNQRVIPLKPNRNKIDQLCQELTLQFCSKDLRKQLRQLSPGPLGKLFSYLRFY